MFNKSDIPTPKKVRIALYILIAIFIEGIIESTYNVFKHKNPFSHPIIEILVTILLYAAIASMLYALYKGKLWPRTVFLILFIISSIGIPIEIYILFKNSYKGFIGKIVLDIFQLVALILLYSKEANEWFNTKRSHIQPIVTNEEI